MVAAEKAGIPAVAIAARSFARAWQSCVDGWGQPNAAFVTIPHATTGQQADFIRNMVDEQIDAIIQGLTALPASAGRPRGAKSTGKGTEIFTVEMDETPQGLNAVNLFLEERDWSDGSPVIPPTPAAVEQMLKGTKRQPQEVVMVMEPGFGLATVENPGNGYRYLGFNMRRPPMDNKAFRQAVATLIDKEFLTRTVLQDVAIPVYTTVPEGNGFWHNPDVPLVGKDLDRTQRIAQAVEYLKGAGFTWETEPKASEDGTFVEVVGRGLKMPNGEPIPELEILAPSPGYDPLRSTFAIWIERWLNDIGIPAEARLTDFNVIVDKIADPDGFDMWILGWRLSIYPDYLDSFFHSRHSTGDGLNRGGYSNPEFDLLADGLLSETDLDEARKKVFKMQEFLADDLPYVVLFTTPILETYRSDRLEFPYTQVLGGIQNANGMTTTVVIK
jgi:ABC-type transport system substrate-binding protein